MIKMEYPWEEFGQIEYAKAERLVTAGKAVRPFSFDRSITKYLLCAFPTHLL